jgi:hypothetical protein
MKGKGSEGEKGKERKGTAVEDKILAKPRCTLEKMD